MKSGACFLVFPHGWNRSCRLQFLGDGARQNPCSFWRDESGGAQQALPSKRVHLTLSSCRLTKCLCGKKKINGNNGNRGNSGNKQWLSPIFAKQCRQLTERGTLNDAADVAVWWAFQRRRRSGDLGHLNFNVDASAGGRSSAILIRSTEFISQDHAAWKHGNQAGSFCTCIKRQLNLEFAFEAA